MTELKPCPFCGGEADEYEGYYGNGIYCMMCGAMVGEPIHEEYRITERVSHERAAKAWNTRTASGDDFSRAVHDGHLWRRRMEGNDGND